LTARRAAPEVLPAEPPTLETIRSPIAEPFERFQTELDDAFLCDVGLVGTVGAHLHRAYGKRFRPTLVLLAAKGFGAVTDDVLIGAVVVVLIHAATLLHDDSEVTFLLRQGLPTVHNAVKNDTAILMGG